MLSYPENYLGNSLSGFGNIGCLLLHKRLNLVGNIAENIQTDLFPPSTHFLLQTHFSFH